jgi:hypothetical protein
MGEEANCEVVYKDDVTHELVRRRKRFFLLMRKEDEEEKQNKYCFLK